MYELGIAFFVIVLLLGLVAAFQAPWTLLLSASVVLVTIGFLLGIPAAVVYHWRLHAELVRARVDRRGWIWNPFGFHRHVPSGRLSRVVPWGYAGGVGFVLIILGIVALLASLGAASRGAASL